MTNVWWDNNSHRVTLTGLTDPDGEYVNDAAVSATMTDLLGNELADVEWPLALSEDGTLTGVYTADLPPDTELEAGQYALVTVTATRNDVVGEWTLKVLVKRRGGC